MKIRAITGFFFIIVMLASVLLGRHVFNVFYLVLALLCLWEFYGLVKQSTAKPDTILGLVIAASIYGLFTWTEFNSNHNFPLVIMALVVATLAVCATFIVELFKRSESPFNNIAYTFMGVIYVMIPFQFFHALAYVQGDFDFHLPLGFLIMLWANDTGAYLSGYFFGRTKLFERHSPKKTWEGFIGGVLIAAVAGFILSRFYTELSWRHWVSVAILIGSFGTLGDLVESMFKRSINVKDSGGILPGHGGLLDRFDGLLIAAPVVFAYLYLIMLCARRLLARRIRLTTDRSDKLLFPLLSLTVLLGFSATAVHNVFGGGYDYRETVSVWFRGVFTLHPQPEAISGAPLLFQLHALSACLLFAAWPFTRLVHVWSAPVGYLVRPYLVYRRRAGTPPAPKPAVGAGSSSGSRRAA